MAAFEVRTDAREVARYPLPLISADWSALLPGIALWALALYLPLSLPLTRLEQALASSALSPAMQQSLLLTLSLLLALLLGALTDLGLGWALGPGWASSLGMIAAGWGLFTVLASRATEDRE